MWAVCSLFCFFLCFRFFLSFLRPFVHVDSPYRFRIESFFLSPLRFPFLILISSFLQFLMARTGATPNNLAPSRNPPPKSRKQPSPGKPSTSRKPPRDPAILSNRAQRPVPSRPNQSQSTPPQTNAIARPIPDYKLLYPWAPPALLNETSLIKSEADILRLRDKTHLTFHKEHDDKVVIRPCLLEEPVCTDNDGNDDHPSCFIYATVFKKVRLRFPLTRFERELLTELDIAPAQLHPNG